MPIVKFNNIASIGIVNDADPFELPPNAWSNGSNVRFYDNKIVKFAGHSSVYGTPTVTPYWAIPVQSSSTYYWVYPGASKVYVTDGTTHTNITRQTAGNDVNYSATYDKGWNGGAISGLLVLNNGVDDPQMWSTTSPSTKLSSLTWDAGNTWSAKGHTCAVMRPFKNYLVALDVTKGATRYPHMVKWSAATVSGAVPASWDETDATNDADEQDLSETGGDLIDCLSMRDINVIYKEDSTWIMQYTGDNRIFAFYEVFKTVGALTRRCIKEFDGRHIVLTSGDLVIHDGNNPQSIINAKMRNWLFNNIDSTYYRRTFITPNYSKNEMWVCFPQSGSTLPDMALVWNYRENTLGVRQIPSAPHIAYGIVDPSENVAWSADSNAWSSDSTSWDQRAYNPTILKLLLCSGTNFFLGDNTDQFNGSSMTAYVERQGLDLGDSSRIKLVKRLRPKIEATGAVTIKVGQQASKNGSVTWTNYSFDPSTDEYVDVIVAGRYIAFRFESSSNISWSLSSYEVEFEFQGLF